MAAPGPAAPARSLNLFEVLGCCCASFNATSSTGNPDAVDDSVIVAEDRPIDIKPLANDTDFDGDEISVVSFTQGANALSYATLTAA